MKTPSKSDLLRENTELRHAVSVRDEYLAFAFRGEVQFIQKGSTRLGICGACRAHGGIVLEAMRDDSGQWSVVGVYYFESRAEFVRSYPVRHDDRERQDWRTCYSRAATEIADSQHKFYAPAVAQAVNA